MRSESSKKSNAAKIAELTRAMARNLGAGIDEVIRELSGDSTTDEGLFISPSLAMALMINISPLIDGRVRWQFSRIKNGATPGTLRTRQRGNIIDVHLLDFFRLVRDIQIDVSGDGDTPPGRVDEEPVTIPKIARPEYRCKNRKCEWTGSAMTEYCPDCGSVTEPVLGPFSWTKENHTKIQAK